MEKTIPRAPHSSLSVFSASCLGLLLARRGQGRRRVHVADGVIDRAFDGRLQIDGLELIEIGELVLIGAVQVVSFVRVNPILRGNIHLQHVGGRVDLHGSGRVGIGQ